MEALFLPFLAVSLLAIIVYGFSNNRPTLEEDEVKAVLPLLKLLHRNEGGLPEDHPGLRPYAREIEHCLAFGYIRRSNRAELVTTEIGDRLRRTGKLTAQPVRHAAR